MLREHWTQISCFCPLQADVYSQSNASTAPTTITPDNKHWVKLTAMANSPACWLAQSHGMLETVPKKTLFYSICQLCAALKQLQLSFRAMVIQSYWVDAVL